jgi:hypothetical protein
LSERIKEKATKQQGKGAQERFRGPGEQSVPRMPLRSFGCDLPLEAGRADKPALMLDDAFATEILATERATADRLTRMMENAAGSIK